MRPVSPLGCRLPLLVLSAFLLAAFSYRESQYPVYPQRLTSCPHLPSPLRADDGTEILLGVTKDQNYTLIPVTVENGAPLDYAHGQWGKGRQQEVDAEDFPTLARTGLHSESELAATTTITGRSVARISEFGRPGRLSSKGFIAEDEDILSVLIGDNRGVSALGLTHPDLARPLFHIWNYILAERENGTWNVVAHFRYHGNRVSVKYSGSKGWMESLFEDEVLGMYQFEVWRELTAREQAYLNVQYAHLAADERTQMVKTLSHIHTGEMVPYYIQRYGFYEGHTEYRADPIAIAFIFGLKSLEEIETAFPAKLDQALARHYRPVTTCTR